MIETQSLVRLLSFAVIFVSMAGFELAASKRTLSQPKGRRWLTNLGLAGIDVAVARVIFPMGLVGIADFASANGTGLLPALNTPYIVSVVISFIALDLVIYGQHVVFHKIPLLWRLHQVHHTDRDIDVTSGLRFHPIEIILSLIPKSVAILILGAPALAVIGFEIALNGAAMFNHSNVALPAGVDRLLRLVIVTPDMHRVHHSVARTETDSNYGFNLSIWDRLFGTTIAQPAAGHTDMVLGLQGFQEGRPAGLSAILALPFERLRAR